MFKLIADRQRVMAVLEASRKEEGRWPEWHLLWEQHAVCEWLDDAVAAKLGGHEAPVVHLEHGLGADESVVLFQGQLSKQRTQPVVVKWFGVSFLSAHSDRAPRPDRVRPLDDATRRLAAIDAARAPRDRLTVPRHVCELREERAAEARQTRDARARWIQEGIRTNSNPYLRVAAALVPA